MNTGLTVIGSFFGVSNAGLGILLYALEAGALYTIARRRGIHKAWLSWIPLINVWMLGCIADQYQYVAKGRDTNRRRSLLILQIVSVVLTVVLMVLGMNLALTVLQQLSSGHGVHAGMVWGLLSSSASTVICGIGLAGVLLAQWIIRAIAMYDLYTSCDPRNNTLYLVLSLVFGAAVPFFLFFGCRDKDDGMPPRRKSAPV